MTDQEYIKAIMAETYAAIMKASGAKQTTVTTDATIAAEVVLRPMIIFGALSQVMASVAVQTDLVLKPRDRRKLADWLNGQEQTRASVSGSELPFEQPTSVVPYGREPDDRGDRPINAKEGEIPVMPV